MRARSPHAGGVVEAEFAAVPVELDRDGVARDAGFRAGEQALLAEQAVDQRGLAGVGPADDRDADRPVGALFVGLGLVVLGRRRGVLGQRGADRVVEIGQALAVLGRDRRPDRRGPSA